MPHAPSWKQLFRDSFFYLIFVLVIVGGFFGLFVLDQLMRVEEIVVTQSGRKIQINGATAFEGKNIVFLSPEEVETALKRDNPAIKSITVSKEYPNLLNVAVTTRSAIVALQGDVGYYLLADDATILEKVREEPKNIPKITYYQKLPFINHQAGGKLDFIDLQMCITFYKNFAKLGLKPKQIDVQDYAMIRFIFDEEKEIRVSAEKKPETQWYQIEQLVKDLEIRGEKWKLIDVRFEKPYFSQ